MGIHTLVDRDRRGVEVEGMDTCARARLLPGLHTADSREHGYSMLDVAVVLTLAGILLAGAVAGITLALASQAIDGWARSMTYEIAAARQAAMTQRATFTVTLTGTTYLISGNGKTLRYGALPKDITLTNTCPSNACSFDRHGVPIATGTVTLTSAKTGRSYVITIQANTGRVSYQ